MVESGIFGEAVLFDLVSVSGIGIGDVVYLHWHEWGRWTDKGFVHSWWEYDVQYSFS